MDPKTKELLKHRHNLPDEIEVRKRRFYPQEYGGSGMKGVVWRCTDEFGQDVAVKLTTISDYGDKSPEQEAWLASKLRGYLHFAQVIDVDVVPIEIEGTRRLLVAFVEDWVEGPTLQEFIERGDGLNANFLMAFIEGICEALTNLKAKELCHDDLRPGNIKIAPPLQGSLTQDEIQIRIVDLGSLKRAPTKKKADDHVWFVSHIVRISNMIRRGKNLPVTDARFLDGIQPLLERMLDEDPTAALNEPSAILHQFRIERERSRAPLDHKSVPLQDPFQYISAEAIVDDRILLDLFAESCPWKGDASNTEPLLLTGPRGCGKSTLFRRLSLKAMIKKGRTELDASQIAGFYISCSTDLKNRINWITTADLRIRYSREVTHYFNLLVTREVVHTLQVMRETSDGETYFGLAIDHERAFCRAILDWMSIGEESRRRLQGISPTEHLLSIIDQEMDACHRAMIRGEPIQHVTPASFVADLSEHLAGSIRYFAARKIVIFVDDLSTRQIPKEAQAILNDVILLERAKHHVYKISSDKHGWTGIDQLASQGDKTREFREVDCAISYLKEISDEQRREFVKELLQRRLTKAGYLGTPDEILGKSSYNTGSLGKEIRDRAESKTEANDVYHGLETITDLCCGDISILLEVFRAIFNRGKVTKTTRIAVPARFQHQAIVAVSRSQYSNLRLHVPHGPEMQVLAGSFGVLCEKLLRSGKKQPKDGVEIPLETAYIELDEPPGHPQIPLNAHLSDLMDELVRRGVFIELEPSRSRRTFLPTIRWRLRPILCPSFNMSLAKSFAWKWSAENFRRFLMSPKDFCEQQFERYKQIPDRKSDQRLDISGA